MGSGLGSGLNSEENECHWIQPSVTLSEDTACCDGLRNKDQPEFPRVLHLLSFLDHTMERAPVVSGAQQGRSVFF